MSKREKQLALRNDKGGYAELYPINPQEVKDTSSPYEMVPMGGASVGVVDTPTRVQPSIKASYCVLEVGNFDGMPPSPDSVPTLHPPHLTRYDVVQTGKMHLRVSEGEGLATMMVASGGRDGGDVTPGDVQKGYCVLEVRNFDEQGYVSRDEPGAREVRTIGAHSDQYQNVELPSSSPSSTRRGNDYINVALDTVRDCEVSRGPPLESSNHTSDPKDGRQLTLSSRYEVAGGGGRGGASGTPGRAPREMVYEVVQLKKQGGGGGDRGGTANKGNLEATTVSGDDEGVFAGLVLSASKQMEEEGERSGGGALMTSWNDEQVSQEWNKVWSVVCIIWSEVCMMWVWW